MPADLRSWLSGTELSAAMRGTSMLYPVLECVHLVAIAALVGPAAVFDLRLLGVGHRIVDVDNAARLLLPLSRIGFVLAVATGIAMLVSNPWAAASPAAPYKLGLLTLAGINIAVFHLGVYRRVGAWGSGPITPAAAKAAGVVSLIAWAGVIVSGRMLAYA